jgi:hypothetical protein
MPTLLSATFRHRRRANGRYDSFCTVCFTTVVTVEKEYELAAAEAMHKCDPEMLSRFGKWGIPTGSFPS